MVVLLETTRALHISLLKEWLSNFFLTRHWKLVQRDVFLIRYWNSMDTVIHAMSLSPMSFLKGLWLKNLDRLVAACFSLVWKITILKPDFFKTIDVFLIFMCNIFEKAILARLCLSYRIDYNYSCWMLSAFRLFFEWVLEYFSGHYIPSCLKVQETERQLGD